MYKKISGIKIPLSILFILIILVLFLLQFDWLWRLFYPLEHETIIIRNAKLYDIDPYLIAAIIFVESKYIEEAESPRGALGLMQIMPNTGRWIAEQMGIENFDVSDLLDPEINIMFGSWYIANLKKQFADEVIMLAAYNAGRGNVVKWLEERWDGKVNTIDRLPFAETRNYIVQVNVVYERYRKIYDIK
ncbi:lytic transglycosylase domain-containing protein [Natronospora cellulosivora (SeqCode)]